ncbi:hypothetical protein [Thalassotalea ganghwensis]
MKELFSNLYRLMVIFTLAIFMQACGSDTPDPTADFSISTDTTVISFNSEFSQTSSQSATINVNFVGQGLLIGFAPEAQAVPWLRFRTEGVNDSSAKVIVELDGVENYRNDIYRTTLRLSTGDVNNTALVHQDVDISLNVRELISFSATLGEQSIESQELTLSIDRNDYTLETSDDWLVVSDETIENTTKLTITPTLSAIEQSGAYQSEIILTETGSGNRSLINVELGVDNLYLYSDIPAVSLSKTNNVENLEQQLTILTNSLSPVNWQATSNVEWLTLAKTDNSLLVSINDNSLPDSEISDAIITVAATDNSQIISAEIPVSFYQKAITVSDTVIEDLPNTTASVVVSPTKPYLYAISGHQIVTYQTFSGELINSVDILADDVEGELSQLIVHPLGKHLLAKATISSINDDESTTITTHRYRVDLETMKVTELTNASIEYEPLGYVSFAGRHFVVTQTLELANENLERLNWDRENAFSVGAIDQARATQSLFALESATATFHRLTTRVNDFTTSKISLTEQSSYRPELLDQDMTISGFIVNNDETALYAASETSEYISFDGNVYTDNGLLSQTEGSITLANAKDLAGNAIYSRFENTETPQFVLAIYNQAQKLVNTIVTSPIQPTDLQITSDGQRALLQYSDQLELVTLERIDLSHRQLEFVVSPAQASIEAQTILINGVSENWSASSNVAWLSLTEEVVDGQSSLTVNINSQAIDGWGLFTGIITIIDSDTGYATKVVVELAIDETRLFANYPSLNFDQQLNSEVLTKTVDIQTNKSSMIAWQANTDVDWLNLTQDNNTDQLTVTVIPENVSENGLHSAEIILTSSIVGESVDGVIKVSFYKSDFDTSVDSELVIEGIEPNDSAVVLDPLRPYLYVAQGDEIKVINVVDGTLVTTVEGLLADVALTNLVIHPDGSKLLASNLETYLDEDDQEATRVNHYQIDLTNFTIAQLNSENIDLDFRPQAVITIDGKPVVVSQALEYANTDLEVQYWDSANAFLTSITHKVANHNNFLAYNGANATIYQQHVRFNAFAEKSITAKAEGSSQNLNFALYGVGGITTNNNGDILYSANPVTEWSSLDGDSYISNGVLPSSQTLATIAVTTDTNDHSYVYRRSFINGYGEAHTLTEYDELQQQVSFVGYSSGSNQVYLSPTYHRVIHYLAEQQQLIIDYIPQD